MPYGRGRKKGKCRKNCKKKMHKAEKAHQALLLAQLKAKAVDDPLLKIEAEVAEKKYQELHQEVEAAKEVQAQAMQNKSAPKSKSKFKNKPILTAEKGGASGFFSQDKENESQASSSVSSKFGVKH